MHDLWVAACVAAAAAATAAVYDHALIWKRARRDAARAEHRASGTGPYAPTHGVPRDVDLALAIADHLRLKWAPTIHLARSVSDAMRVSLRAAVALAHDLPGSTTTTTEG